MASSSSSIRNRHSIADNNHNDPRNTSIHEPTHTQSLINSPELSPIRFPPKVGESSSSSGRVVPPLRSPMPHVVGAPSSSSQEPLRIRIQDGSNLECPICYERFKLGVEIRSCLANGHSVCYDCVKKMPSRVCPVCEDADLTTRNIGLELILKATSAPCENHSFGCLERLKLVDPEEHKSVCPYTLCFCPFPSCIYSGTGNMTYNHFSNTHSTPQTKFTFGQAFTFDTETNPSFFQEEATLGPIFILNQTIDNDANERQFEVQCLGPPHIEHDGQSYECNITICCGERSRTGLVARFKPTFCCKWVQGPPTNKFLAVSLTSGVISKATLLITCVPSKAGGEAS